MKRLINLIGVKGITRFSARLRVDDHAATLVESGRPVMHTRLSESWARLAVDSSTVTSEDFTVPICLRASAIASEKTVPGTAAVRILRRFEAIRADGAARLGPPKRALTSVVGLLLVVMIGVALGAWTAADAATPTVQAQSGVAPLATGVQTQAVTAELPTTKEEHGLPQAAVQVFNKLGRLPITNSMVLVWIVAISLIVFAQAATRKMKRIPAGAQNFWEWLVESLRNFLEGIIGRHLVQRTFWFFASIFIFILAANWCGLIPGVGTVGWGKQGAHGFKIEEPLLRGANADLNLTLAMALVFMGCWLFWSLREIGLMGCAKELFAPKGETTGFLKVVMVIVFFAAGCIEIISILFRPVSLSFRLYGNIFAGENMLETMAGLVPNLGWLLPIPFYFLELLVGLVQAMVFMLLTAVFTLLMCQHEEAGPAGAHD